MPFGPQEARALGVLLSWSQAGMQTCPAFHSSHSLQPEILPSQMFLTGGVLL